MAGVWSHVVVTYDGSIAKIYVNGNSAGSLAVSAAATGWLPNTQSSLRVGGTPLNGSLSDNPAPDDVFNFSGQGHSGNRGWDGWVDELAVYTGVLSADTVKAHFDAATTNSAGYGSQILTSNPVGYWNMNEPAVAAPDPSTFPILANSGSLGSDADGTNMWGALSAQPGSGNPGLGAADKSVFFDSANGYIALKDAAGLHFSGNITMMAWIKPTVQDFYRTIIAHGWDDTHTETFLRISRGVGGTGAGDGNYYEVGVTDSLNYYDAVLFPMPAGDIGNWVFIAGTYDGANWNLYRNGALVGSYASAAGPVDVTNRWSIGSRSGPSPQTATPIETEGLFFGGWIDEPAIFGTALSAAAINTIYNAAQVAPVITRAPKAPAPLYLGDSATLSVWAEGTPPLTYQWLSNGVAMAGQVATNLTLSGLTTASSATYSVVVANSYGSITGSTTLTVTGILPPVTLVPATATRYDGGTFKFTAISSSSSLSYQWYRGTSPLAGATASSYTATASSGVAGNYYVVVTNNLGSGTSSVAPLTVIAKPPGYPSAVLANNPAAYWRLGEASGSTAYDYSGGLDGAFDSVTLGVSGYSVIDADKAIGVGNVNSYVGGINGTNFNPSGHPVFSVEAWVNGPAGQGDESTIIAKGAGSDGTTASEQFALDVVGGNYRFFTRGGGNSLYEAIAPVGPNGTWQHVVGVYDDQNLLGVGTNMYIYVNGELAGTGTPRPSGVRNRRPLYRLGRSAWAMIPHMMVISPAPLTKWLSTVTASVLRTFWPITARPTAQVCRPQSPCSRFRSPITLGWARPFRRRRRDGSFVLSMEERVVL